MPTCYIKWDSHTVEFGVIPVERQFRLEKENIFPNKGAVSCALNESTTGQTKRRHTDVVALAQTTSQRNCIPRIPSPATPLIKLSTQLTCCCPSRTTAGCPSCKTLCIVIRALNVWTSSARTGCLYSSGKGYPLATYTHGESIKATTYTFMPAQKAAEDLWSHV